MEASLKKNILIGIAVFAGVLLLGAAGWFVYFNLQFSTYQDDQYKFTIKYPKAWKVVANPKPTVAVVFLRPKDTPLDTLQGNFSVVVQHVSQQDEVLATFNANVKKQMSAVFGQNIIIAEDRPLQCGWRQGHEMVFEAPTPDHLIMVNAWILREDQAYIMTFWGDVNKYAGDKLNIDEMLRSLRVQ